MPATCVLRRDGFGDSSTSPSISAGSTVGPGCWATVHMVPISELLWTALEKVKQKDDEKGFEADQDG